MACNFVILCSLQQLESVCWMEDGGNILSSHSDGSYCQWTVTGEDPQTEPEKQEMPYGKTALQKLLVFSYNLNMDIVLLFENLRCLKWCDFCICTTFNKKKKLLTIKVCSINMHIPNISTIWGQYDF